MLKERNIEITLNVTLSELAEMIKAGNGDYIEDRFQKELDIIEKLIINEIVSKVDKRTLQHMWEYFKVSNIIAHFDTSEFFNTLEDAVNNRAKIEWE